MTQKGWKFRFNLCGLVLTACIPHPLGMEDGLITRDQISVSSTHSSTEKNWGRLNNPHGSWTPNTDLLYQWFQVNFDPYHLKLITHIATQGNGIHVWYVTRYYVMYKAGDSPLQEYHEDNKRKVRTIYRYPSSRVYTQRLGRPLDFSRALICLLYISELK